MRKVQESRRRVREEMLLRVHLELLRHPRGAPVRNHPLACCKVDDLMLLVLDILVRYSLDNSRDWYMLHGLDLQP